MSNKRFLSIKDAIAHPDCPFDDERQIRNRLHSSRPKIDTSGKVLDEGDPDFLACFVKASLRHKGQILVDLPRLVALIDSRRLNRAA